VEGSQGKSRAAVVTELLAELNDRVKGHAVDKDPTQLIQNDINFFKQFTVIIASGVPQEPLLQLAQFCWANHIPLVVARVWGFIGYVRVTVDEHTGKKLGILF
jgi:amyloid beta precursor protein binding protein 1